MSGQRISGIDDRHRLDESEALLVDTVAALDVPARSRTVPDAAVAPGSTLTWRRLDVLFDAQVASRNLDHAARWLRSEGRGFYTIGSAGHEANAFVAAALRPTDPALLHYRSGAFYLARAQQVRLHDGVGDILRGLLAAADEPIAGGRHKVFGNADLAVIPQTSTIASQLPRALGVAYAIGAADELDVDTQWPTDALAVCSFGDASLNHSTAQGSINAAAQMAHRGVPLPLLLVCEDNGLGISVPTPAGWVAASLSNRPGVPYLHADGQRSARRLRGRRGAGRRRARRTTPGDSPCTRRAVRRSCRNRCRVRLPRSGEHPRRA